MRQLFELTPVLPAIKRALERYRYLAEVKGVTTKPHAVVDALGQALRFTITRGNRHDITQASLLIGGFEIS